MDPDFFGAVDPNPGYEMRGKAAEGGHNRPNSPDES